MTPTPAPSEILPGFYFFQRGFLNANHFAYRSARPVLIDTGYIGDWETTETLFPHRPGSGSDRPDHQHPHPLRSYRRQPFHPASFGLRHCLASAGRPLHAGAGDRSPWWSYYHQEAAFFDPTESLADGQEIQVGPYGFEVIHTPGHASDGLVLYCRSRRILLSSDALWENDFPVMTLAVEGENAIETMLTSLHKIAALEVERVFPGHGAPFDDFNAARERATARLERFRRDPQLVGWDLVKKILVYTLLMKGRVPRATFFENLMVTNWYPDTINRYFAGDCQTVFDKVITDFDRRGIIGKVDEDWVTTVKP